MTYIEFFARDALENLCSCLTFAPDKVIMIGDNRKLMQKHAKRYELLLRARGEVVEFEVVSVDRNKVATLVKALERIVENERECLFDLTGGEDLLLVAMGIVFERHRDENLQMHRFNLRNNNVYDCDMDGIVTLKGEAPEISVKELIYAYGGDVAEEGDPLPSTPEWEWTDEFLSQIDDMWAICRKGVRQWNAQIDTFGMVDAYLLDSWNSLRSTVPMPYLNEYMEKQGRKFYENARIIRALVDAGLLNHYKHDAETLTIEYASEQIKRCMTKAGQILELIVCAAAKRAKEADGRQTYQDALTGVTIDWDGNYATCEDQFDTANEIDVILTHGMVPVFVSCKNGDVDSNELYKLKTVADRFGGKYAKKVLIATAVDPGSTSGQYLLQRADDMDICVITGFQKLVPEEMEKLIGSLWKLQRQQSAMLQRQP